MSWRVLQMIGEGLGSREISEKPGVSSKTVETYRMHIRRRLGPPNATVLFERAAEWIRDASAESLRTGSRRQV